MSYQILHKQVQPFFFATVACFLDVGHLQSRVSCLTDQLPYFKAPDLHKTAQNTGFNNKLCEM